MTHQPDLHEALFNMQKHLAQEMEGRQNAEAQLVTMTEANVKLTTDLENANRVHAEEIARLQSIINAQGKEPAKREEPASDPEEIEALQQKLAESRKEIGQLRGINYNIYAKAVEQRTKHEEELRYLHNLIRRQEIQLTRNQNEARVERANREAQVDDFMDQLDQRETEIDDLRAIIADFQEAHNMN